MLAAHVSILSVRIPQDPVLPAAVSIKGSFVSVRQLIQTFAPGSLPCFFRHFPVVCSEVKVTRRKVQVIQSQ